MPPGVFCARFLWWPISGFMGEKTVSLDEDQW